MEPEEPKDLDTSPKEILADLCKGRRIDKSCALATIPRLTDEARTTLLGLLEQALLAEFPPGKRTSERYDARAKSWMVHAFMTLHAGKADGYAASVRGYLDPRQETDDWVRYWALVGLVNGDLRRHATPALLAVCHELVDPHLPPDARASGDAAAFDRLLARLAGGNARDLALALVILIRQDRLSAAPVRAALAGYGRPEEPEMSKEMRNACHAVLRALRVVPLPDDHEVLCERVEDNNKPSADLAYEAAAALGELGAYFHDQYQGTTLSPQTRRIAHALHMLVEHATDKFYMDMARWAALRSLGKTCAEVSVPILLPELSDDNPIIAQSAGRALACLLKTPAAVELVVKEVVQHKRRADSMAEALRGMERTAVVETLLRLSHELPSEQREGVQGLLVEFGGALAFQRIRAQTESLNRYDAAMGMFRKHFLDNFRLATTDARRWGYAAITSDFLLYAVGLALLVSATWLVLHSRDTAAAFTALAGFLTFIVTKLISNPRKLISTSVQELVRLEAVFAAYIRELHQVDLAFVQRILDGQPIDARELQQQSALLQTAMQGALDALAGRRNANAAPLPAASDAGDKPGR